MSVRASAPDMGGQGLPDGVWAKEHTHPGEFFAAMAEFIYTQPRHGEKEEEDEDEEWGSGTRRGRGWWCGQPRVMRSLLTVLCCEEAPIDDFREESARQLSRCSGCARSYVEQREIWRVVMSGQGVSMDSPMAVLKHMDLQRWERSWNQRKLSPNAQPENRAAGNAVLEVLLDINMCLDASVLQALENFFVNAGPPPGVAEAMWRSGDPSTTGPIPLGLYALCFRGHTKCRTWAMSVLKKYGRVEDNTTQLHVNAVFLEIMTRIADERLVPQVPQMFAPKRTELTGEVHFWEGLHSVLSLYSPPCLRELLTNQPGLPELLLYGIGQRPSSIKHVLASLQLLLEKLNYKLWLNQTEAFTPHILAETIAELYNTKSLFLEERKTILTLFSLLTTSLKAFDPVAMSETCDLAIHFMAEVADVWKRGRVTKEVGDQQMIVFGQEAFLKVALLGYELQRPNSPSPRESWVRVLFQILRNGNEFEMALRLFRVVGLTTVATALHNIPHAVGSLSLEFLPQPFDHVHIDLNDAEPQLASLPYFWNGIAGLHHRKREASQQEIVREISILFEVYEYVHFIHRPDVAVFTEQHHLALATILQIQDAMTSYFGRLAEQVRQGAVDRMHLKSAIAPHVGNILCCSYDTLRRSAIGLLRTAFKPGSLNDPPIELMKQIMTDPDRRRVLESIYGTIEKVNRLRISGASPVLRQLFKWLPVVFSAADTDVDLIAESQELLSREGLFTLACNTLEDVLEERDPEFLSTTAASVLSGLRKIWTYLLYNKHSSELHHRLLALLLGWAPLSCVQREWQRTMQEVTSRFGRGEPECAGLASKLMGARGENALSEEAKAFLAKLYFSPARPTHEVKELTGKNDEALVETVRGKGSSGGKVVTGVPRTKTAPDDEIQRMKTERVKEQMKVKIKRLETKWATEDNIQPVLTTIGPHHRSKPQKARQKRQRVRNLTDLQDTILKWTVFSLMDKERDKELEAEEYPASFASAEAYTSFWEPLLIEEVRASIRRAFEELKESERSAVVPEKGPFLACQVTTAPERRDRTCFIGAETKTTQTGALMRLQKGQEGSLKGEDLALVRVELQDGTEELLALVVDTGVFAGGTRRRFQLKLFQQPAVMSLLPGKDIQVAKLTGLVTHQRQYEALWSASKIHPRMLGDILQSNNVSQQEVDKGNAGVTRSRNALPREMQQLLLHYHRRQTLNESQFQAVEDTLLNSRSATVTGGFMLLQGPPGTGKTSTILALLSALLSEVVTQSGPGPRMTRKILVSAPSNAAVDELLKRVMTKGLDHPDGVGKYSPTLVRIGEGTTMEEVECVSLMKLVKGSGDANPESANRDLEDAMDTKHQALQSVTSFNEMISECDTARRELRATRAMSTKLGGDNNEYETEKALQEDRKLTDKLTRLHDMKHKAIAKVERARSLVDKAKQQSESARNRKIEDILKSAVVVFSTLNSSGHQILKTMQGGFDVVIIDEAAQAVEPEVLIPLSVTGSKRIPHCIMVGDAMQLPATVLSTSPGVLAVYKRSLFERLENARKGTTAESLMLRTQYRMHPLLSLFPSHQFYGGRIDDALQVQSKNYSRPYHLDKRGRFGPLTFLDTSGAKMVHREERTPTGSLRNRFEVEVCMMLLSSLVKLYPKEKLQEAIAVLTPYKTQVRDMKAAMHRRPELKQYNIEVCTVDGIQGREKDIVVLSTVRSDRSQNAGIGFVKDERRLNVAATRAKYSLILVGNAEILAKNSRTWASYIELCARNDCMKTLDGKLQSLFPEAVMRKVKPASFSEGQRSAHAKKLENTVHAARSTLIEARVARDSSTSGETPKEGQPGGASMPASTKVTMARNKPTTRIEATDTVKERLPNGVPVGHHSQPDLNGFLGQPTRGIGGVWQERNGVAAADEKLEFTRGPPDASIEAQSPHPLRPKSKLKSSKEKERPQEVGIGAPKKRSFDDTDPASSGSANVHAPIGPAKPEYVHVEGLPDSILSCAPPKSNGWSMIIGGGRSDVGGQKHKELASTGNGISGDDHKDAHNVSAKRPRMTEAHGLGAEVDRVLDRIDSPGSPILPKRKALSGPRFSVPLGAAAAASSVPYAPSVAFEAIGGALAGQSETTGKNPTSSPEEHASSLPLKGASPQPAHPKSETRMKRHEESHETGWSRPPPLLNTKASGKPGPGVAHSDKVRTYAYVGTNPKFSKPKSTTPTVSPQTSLRTSNKASSSPHGLPLKRPGGGAHPRSSNSAVATDLPGMTSSPSFGARPQPVNPSQAPGGAQATHAAQRLGTYAPPHATQSHRYPQTPGGSGAVYPQLPQPAPKSMTRKAVRGRIMDRLNMNPSAKRGKRGGG